MHRKKEKHGLKPRIYVYSTVPLLCHNCFKRFHIGELVFTAKDEEGITHCLCLKCYKSFKK